MPPDELHKTKLAIEGLQYPSESDAPFDPFLWEATGATSAQAQVAARARRDQMIQEIPLATLFAQLDDTDDAPRFRQLQAALQSELADLRVFRAGHGQVQVDLYVIGKTPTGRWAGLHTTSVET